MNSISYRTPVGAGAELPAEKVEALQGRLGGLLIGRETPDYDTARALWNGMIDTRPALIARCAGVSDVIQALAFAREHDMDLSVRGGGHNIAGTALCDDGLNIDLSAMRAVRVSPETGTAWVQGGALWGEVDREAQAFGQVVPSGIVSSTGVAGLTLGGGFGWLTRRFGLTCDHLLAVDLVTAEGEHRQVTPESDPELFWALQGGGGNFGVVTGFSFRTQTAGPTVLGGMVIHDFAQARELAAFFRDFTANAPETLGSLLIVRPAPPAPFLPERLHGRLIAAYAVCHAGPPERAERELAAIRRWGNPAADMVGPKPFRAVQAMLDTSQPKGLRYYWKSDFLSRLDDEAIDTLMDHAGRMTSPHSRLLVMHMGGASRRVPDPGPAAALRNAEYVVNIAAGWEDAADGETHVGWARDFWQAMRPHAAGSVYVNFLTADETQSRLDEAYGAEVRERLARVKARMDPDNVFRHNSNIRPARVTMSA